MTEYRDVKLPPGMTRVCLDDLARLFNDRCAFDCEQTNQELAVRAYQVVLGHPPKTESLIPQLDACSSRLRGG